MGCIVESLPNVCIPRMSNFPHEAMGLGLVRVSRFEKICNEGILVVLIQPIAKEGQAQVGTHGIGVPVVLAVGFWYDAYEQRIGNRNGNSQFYAPFDNSNHTSL